LANDVELAVGWACALLVFDQFNFAHIVSIKLNDIFLAQMLKDCQR